MDNYRTIARTRATWSRGLRAAKTATAAESPQNILLQPTVNILRMITAAVLMSSTVSESGKPLTKPDTDGLDRGLKITKGQFVFVKHDSDDWLAHVEKLYPKKLRKVRVRWTKEDGPGFVMDGEYADLSVDTIQDIAPWDKCVVDPGTEQRKIYTVPYQARLVPIGDQHTPSQTVSGEQGESKPNHIIARPVSFTHHGVARTGRDTLTGDNSGGDNSGGGNNPVQEM